MCSLSYCVLLLYLTNSMEHSPSWEANSHSISQEIPYLLWNPKIHYQVNKSLLLVPIPSQIYQVHTFPLYSLRSIHSNVILPCIPMASEWPLPFRFSDQNFVHSSHLPHAICPTHLIFLVLITLIIFGEGKVMKLLIMQSSLVLLTSSLLAPNILVTQVIHLRYTYSLNARDKVSHPYKIRGKITVLYILDLKLLYRKQEDKGF